MTTETKFTVGEYKTRGGMDAKVFIVNEDGTLVGARQFTDGSWSSEMWFGDGRVKVIGNTPHDLMPPLREWWIAVHPEGHLVVAKSEGDAKWLASTSAEIIPVIENPNAKA